MKKKGALYEVLFRAEALKNDLDVFIPEGDYSAIDCIVLNAAGVTFRVQVKGTNCIGSSEGSGRKRSMDRFKIVLGRGKRKNINYLPTEIDILACYIEPRDEWFIIPMLRVHKFQTLTFFLGEDSNSQWQAYRNKWDIFLQ